MIRRTQTETVTPSRRGFSLVELMVALAILAAIIAFAAPSFRRTIEQSRADIAVANLRAIWTAERLYWLENRAFTDSLSALESLDLVDSTIGAASEPYTYGIDAADATTFTATATRSGSGAWTGSFTISETGAVTGSISASGEPDITPSFQD